MNRDKIEGFMLGMGLGFLIAHVVKSPDDARRADASFNKRAQRAQDLESDRGEKRGRGEEQPALKAG